jgi:hypothetical protein
MILGVAGKAKLSPAECLHLGGDAIDEILNCGVMPRRNCLANSVKEILDVGDKDQTHTISPWRIQ